MAAGEQQTQCNVFVSQNAKQPVPGPDENVLREDQFGVPVSSMYTTEDGQCHDEMCAPLTSSQLALFTRWSLCAAASRD